MHRLRVKLFFRLLRVTWQLLCNAISLVWMSVALICFSAWLNPTLAHLFVEKGWMKGDAAANLATMICSAVQFFLYFPVDKILFRKPKEEKATQ